MHEETTFFSFNKKQDFDKGSAHNLIIDDEGVRLDRNERFGWKRDVRLAQIEGPAPIRTIARGRDEKLFLLDSDASVWVYDPDNHYVDWMFRGGHGLFSERAEIASAGELFFVADRDGEQKLTAYLISTSQVTWNRNEWKGNPLYPLAIAADEQSNLYALVPLETTEHRGVVSATAGSFLAVLRINRAGVITQVYQHESLRVERQIALRQFNRRFFLAVSQDGALHLLDSRTKNVIVFEESGDEELSFVLDRPVQASGIGVDSQRSIYISDGRSSDLEGEDERFLLHYSAKGEFVGNVSGFRGKADRLQLGGADKMYVWSQSENLVTVLELKPRTKMLGIGGPLEGVYFTPTLDSTSTETIWHKIQLDADLPDETQLRVFAFSSDRKEHIINGKAENLDDYIRDPDRTLQEKRDGLRDFWSPPILNPKDALLMKAQGRYLWLMLEWVGSEKSSPLLQKLRVYFPRTSYLDYLPAVYQEDKRSRDFLERFLSLFGTFLGEMEETIAHIAKYFDPDSTSGDFLRWLATWVGIAAEDAWTDEQVRELLKRTPELYKKRGTRQGLEEMIEIFTGEKPLIVEYFQYKNLIEKAEIRAYMEQLYGLDPYCFCVLLKPHIIQSEKQRFLVEKIIEQDKPAFTESRLIVLQPLIYMGTHTYLGINTFLSQPDLLVLDDKQAMPFNTVLIDVDRENRIGLHTRLELDAELD